MMPTGDIREHMEVVGSDRKHVGRVDHIKGDQIELARTDMSAGGRHHLIPVTWVDSVEGDTVRLNRTADEAKQSWTTGH